MAVRHRQYFEGQRLVYSFIRRCDRLFQGRTQPAACSSRFRQDPSFFVNTTYNIGIDDRHSNITQGYPR